MNLGCAQASDPAHGLPGAFINLMVRGCRKNLRYTADHFFCGRTALMMAAMFNRVDMVDYLLGQGANPKATDAQGATALAAAQTMGAVDTAAQLQKLV